MRRLRRPAWAGLVLLSALARAADAPPPPTRYFNDYAGLVAQADAERLDAALRRFDQETSSQILTVIYPELPSASMEDFTVRAAQSWRVGQKKLDNGVVLFVFVKDRKARLEVGYGMEGALPDALAKRIIEQKLVPAFAAGRYAQGLEAALEAVMAATRGEYQAAPASKQQPAGGGAILVLVAVFLVVFLLISRRLRSLPIATYRSTGYTASPWGIRRRRQDGWGGGWGGGGWGGGGGFSGGGGGFSGGGGSFGGGGASGSW
jgi:uncharacterized protein